jgi:hypothetical protein
VVGMLSSITVVGFSIYNGCALASVIRATGAWP